MSAMRSCSIAKTLPFGHDPIIRSEGGLMSRAIDIVREVAPRGKPAYVAAFEHGDGLLKQHEINTPNRLAHFLAQMMHECGGLRIDWEDMDYSARVCRHSGLCD